MNRMINLFFYLSSAENAQKLVGSLLRERLVAHAAISEGAETMNNFDGSGEIRKEYVITAQTKAVLFEEISAFVTKNYQDEIRIFSLPIAQCNDAFSEVIRNRTKDPG